MKIYYAHSIRGQHQVGEREPMEVISLLKGLGCEVLSEEIWTANVSLTDVQIYARDTQMIHECDVVLANVTNTSLGVGYEIAYGEALGKQIICFYQSNLISTTSAMISGNTAFSLHPVSDINELKTVLSL